MTIEAELPDGTILEFPDGTADEVVDRTVKKHLEETKSMVANPNNERPADHGFWHTLGDNVIGFDDGVQSWGETAGKAVNDAAVGVYNNPGEFSKAAVESATLGALGDEARAGALTGIGYLTGSDLTYDQQLELQRQKEDEFRKNNPEAAFVADASGFLVPGTAALKGIKGTATLGKIALGGDVVSKGGMIAKVAKSAAMGGAAGATYGYAEGEGGMNERLNNAVVPAALGLGLGAATPVLGSLARGAYEKLGPGVAAEARKLTDQLGLNRETAEIVTDAIRRDAPHSADALARAGDDAIVGEMGVNTTMLLDVLANRRGSAEAVRKGVEDIATTRAGKFTSALDDKLGTPTGADRRVGRLMDETAPSRDAAYKDAYSRAIDYSTAEGQAVKELFGRLPRSEMAKINDLLQLEGLPAIKTNRVVDPATGIETVEYLPDVRQVDFIKRNLSGKAEKLMDRNPHEGIIYENFSRNLGDALGDSVPEFRAASNLGQNTIKDREAVELGSNLFSKRNPVDVVETKLEGMSKSELNFARLGLRDTIGEMMDNAKRAMTDTNMDVREIMAPLREITSAGGQAKLRALLGEEAEAVLKAADEAYSGLSLRANVVRGSGTVTRQIMNEQLDGTVSPGVMEALQRGDGPTGALGTLVARLAGNPAAGRLAKVDANAQKIANALLQRAKGSRMVQELPGLMDDVAKKGAAADGATQRIARIANALQARRTSRN